MRTISFSFTVLLCAILLLGCAGGDATQQQALLPQHAKDEIISRQDSLANKRNIQIEITGEGTVLPFEQDQGVDKQVCLKVRYEEKFPLDRWASGIRSGIVQQIGNDWIVNNALLWVERAWYQHSCPGTYESIVPQ
jgi:hypothetical protein